LSKRYLKGLTVGAGCPGAGAGPDDWSTWDPLSNT
jgi:hypothetical protein